MLIFRGVRPRNLKQIQANTTSLQQTSKTLGDTHFAIRIRITTSLKKSHVPNNSRGPKTNSRIRWFFCCHPETWIFLLQCEDAELIIIPKDLGNLILKKKPIDADRKKFQTYSPC